MTVVELGNKLCEMSEITELVSNQFVAKVMSLIRSGDFRLAFSE